MPKEMTVDRSEDVKGLRQVVSFHDEDGDEVEPESKDAVRAVVLYYRGEVLVRRGTFDRVPSRSSEAGGK